MMFPDHDQNHPENYPENYEEDWSLSQEQMTAAALGEMVSKSPSSQPPDPAAPSLSPGKSSLSQEIPAWFQKAYVNT